MWLSLSFSFFIFLFPSSFELLFTTSGNCQSDIDNRQSKIIPLCVKNLVMGVSFYYIGDVIINTAQYSTRDKTCKDNDNTNTDNTLGCDKDNDHVD